MNLRSKVMEKSGDNLDLLIHVVQVTERRAGSQMDRVLWDAQEPFPTFHRQGKAIFGGGVSSGKFAASKGH